MKTTEIEVIDPIILTHNTQQMSTAVKTVDQLSETELEALLAEKRKAKQQEAIAKKNSHEAAKNNFVNRSAETFMELRDTLAKLKECTTSRAIELYEEMYKIDGKAPKDTKSFSLKNTEDTVKVTIDRQERFSFTDGAIVHINAIKDIFKEKFAPRNKGLYEILNGLLIKGSQGEYDPKLLAKARNQVRKLGDEKLIAEFDKLDDCQRVSSTALYCRLHIKDAKGKYQDVSLQFSSL